MDWIVELVRELALWSSLALLAWGAALCAEEALGRGGGQAERAGNVMRTELHPVQALILLAAGLLCATVVHAQEAHPAAAVLKSPIMLTPEDIRWGACPKAVPPGASCAVIEGSLAAANTLFAYRVKMPDNYRIPPHFHPVDEHLVVISGVFSMGHGDKMDLGATRSMTAGSFMVMPKGMPHFASTRGETIIQVYGIGPWGLTYVDARDDPGNQ
jgi:quercetin dioxygenase-like cupin family protein